jgi:hypothetical protein
MTYSVHCEALKAFLAEHPGATVQRNPLTPYFVFVHVPFTPEVDA